MEKWRRGDVASADADFGEAMGEEPECGLGKLWAADVFVEDRREVGALRE